MPQKVVGLDIGLRSIKAVQLTSTLRGYELTHFARCDLPSPEEEGGVSERSRIVESLLKENGFSGDTIISSLSCNNAIISYMELPFSDPRKIRQIVKFEVEPYCPIPIEDVVVDFQIMEHLEGGKTKVLTAIAKKSTIEEHLMELKSAGLDPRIIDIELFASYNCLVHLNSVDLDGGIVFLDIGRDHTGLNILIDGLPKFCRSIPYGGDIITATLSSALTVEVEEAEKLKRSTPLPIEESSEKTANVLSEALNPLLKEIKLTLHSMHSLFQNNMPFKVVLTGGGAKLQNIEQFFSRMLGMPAYHLQTPVGSLPGLEKIEPGEKHYMATGIGLALRGINRGIIQANMRQEEFSVLHRFQEIRGKLTFLGIALALLLALGLTDIFISLHIKESRYKVLKQDIRETFKRTFPDIKNIVAELPQARMRIKEEKNRVSLLGGTSGNGNMIDILEAIHLTVPKQLNVRITDLNVDEKWLLIAGETDSFDIVNKIKTSLSASSFFEGVKIESAKMSNIAGVVEFKFKAQRK